MSTPSPQPALNPYIAGTAVAALAFALAGAPQSPTAVLGREVFAKVTPDEAFGSSRRRLPLVPADLTRTAQADERIAELPQWNRPTTAAEHAVGELRSWTLYGQDWDGEGASAPIVFSLSEAVAFIFATTGRPISDPEPVLHPNGRAGLFWNEPGLYADLEFYGDGRVTYYVEHSSVDKARGVTNFDGHTLPAVLAALLAKQGNERRAA